MSLSTRLRCRGMVVHSWNPLDCSAALGFWLNGKGLDQEKTQSVFFTAALPNVILKSIWMAFLT